MAACAVLDTACAGHALLRPDRAWFAPDPVARNDPPTLNTVTPLPTSSSSHTTRLWRGRYDEGRCQQHGSRTCDDGASFSFSGRGLTAWPLTVGARSRGSGWKSSAGRRLTLMLACLVGCAGLRCHDQLDRQSLWSVAHDDRRSRLSPHGRGGGQKQVNVSARPTGSAPSSPGRCWWEAHVSSKECLVAQSEHDTFFNASLSGATFAELAILLRLATAKSPPPSRDLGRRLLRLRRAVPSGFRHLETRERLEVDEARACPADQGDPLHDAGPSPKLAVRVEPRAATSGVAGESSAMPERLDQAAVDPCQPAGAERGSRSHDQAPASKTGSLVTWTTSCPAHSSPCFKRRWRTSGGPAWR